MIIVTGAAGFIGSALAWRLNRLGHGDLLLVDHLGAADKWRNLSGLSYTDYLDKRDFLEAFHEGAFPDCEAVFHMGACSSTTERDADYLMFNNAVYTRDLARICAARKVRLLYASSAATYGAGEQGYSDDPGKLDDLRPLNMYGYSKQLADSWLRQEGLLDSAVGFKFFNVFGPNEYHKGSMRSMVLKAWEQFRDTGKVSLFANHRDGHSDGDETRDFVYVKDVVETMIAAWKDPAVNGVYNLGTGEPRSFLHLVQAVFKALGREPAIEWIPMPPELRGQYQYYTCADTARLAAAGLPVPRTSLEDAVRDYVCNYLEKDCARLDAARD